MPAGDDPVLGKMVEAVMDGYAKPEDIAEAAGLTAAAVYQGNRKLRRRLEAAAKRRLP